jgi:hypothetical protein
MSNDELEQSLAEIEADLWPDLSSPPWSLDDFERAVFKRKADR